MAYSLVIGVNNGTAGLTLKCALSNSDGTPHATVRDIAVTEIAQGLYRANLSTIPDSYSGTAQFYTGTLGVSTTWAGGASVVLLSMCSINPQESENSNVKSSTLALASTALSSAVWTNTKAGFIDGPLSDILSAASDASSFAEQGLSASGDATINLATANASLVKIQAAMYDSATLSGSTLTLSNGATMVVTGTGRVTTP